MCARITPYPRPEDSPDIFSEDDFHAIATDVAGWTNREFNSLFDGHRALILGMSLSDPNVRRVLSAAALTRLGLAPKHFAIVPTSQKTPEEQYTSKCRSWYWQQYGVEFVQPPNYESILPFLMRLRYESYGAAPGHLWRDGARICAGIDAWRVARQQSARAVLTGAIAQLKQDFAVSDPSEIIEIGVFLLKDATTLELTFRGGGPKAAVQGDVGRTFSVDPDNPTGVAGRAFVSSDLVRISRQHALQDYDIVQARPASTDYEGIVSVAVIDWLHGGISLSVAYLATRTTDGAIFSLPETSFDTTQRSTQDLYVWLHDVAMSLIETFRS